MSGTEPTAPVAAGRWSGPIEGTYNDDPAAASGRSRVGRHAQVPAQRAAVAAGAATAVTARVSLRRSGPVDLRKRVDLRRRVTRRRRVSLVKRPADQLVRWAAFAPPVVQPPGRVRRVWRRVLAVAGHEWTVASVASLLLAVAFTWPALRWPTRTVPHDLGAPLAEAWRLAWAGHAAKSAPGSMWHGNAFFPERFGLLHGDPLLGYLPAALIGDGPYAAVLRWNLLYTLTFALAFLGAYALVRQLGGSRSGAAVAGAAFAFAPWRFGADGTLVVLSCGGAALALAMLARGHGLSLRTGYRPDRVRVWWAGAGWLLAAWQVSLGLSVGLPFAYLLFGAGVAALVGWAVAPRLRLRGWWAARRRLPLRVVLVDVGGGATVAAVAAVLVTVALPVTEATVGSGSMPAHGFLVAPEGSWLWGGRHEWLRLLLPGGEGSAYLLGYVLVGLALAGLVYSVWSWYTRFALLAVMALSAALALGIEAPLDGRYSYLPVSRALPGWSLLHTPRHLAVWVTLCAALLGAGAVSAFAAQVRRYAAGRVPYRPGALLTAAMALPVVLVLAEGVSVGALRVVPRVPVELRTAEAPVLVLPFGRQYDQVPMLWSTDGFPALVNGTGEVRAVRDDELRKAAAQFPDAASVRLFESLGIRTVVVLKARVIGTPFARAARVDPSTGESPTEEPPIDDGATDEGSPDDLPSDDPPTDDVATVDLDVEETDTAVVYHLNPA